MRNLEWLLDIEQTQLLSTTHDMAAARAPLDERSTREDVHRYFVDLALEAYRRDEITRSKLCELAAMVALGRNDVENLLTSLHLD